MVSASPGLIAAAHVLHRLLVPRHPPCALSLLTGKNIRDAAMEFSRCTGSRPDSEAAATGGLSKLNSVHVEVDVVPGVSASRTADRKRSTIDGAGAYGSWSSRIP